MAPYPIVIENINGKPRIFSVSNTMLPSVIVTDGNFPYMFRIAKINFLQAMFVLLLLIIKKRCLIDDTTIGHVSAMLFSNALPNLCSHFHMAALLLLTNMRIAIPYWQNTSMGHIFLSKILVKLTAPKLKQNLFNFLKDLLFA